MRATSPHGEFGDTAVWRDAFDQPHVRIGEPKAAVGTDHNRRLITRELTVAKLGDRALVQPQRYGTVVQSAQVRYVPGRRPLTSFIPAKDAEHEKVIEHVRFLIGE
jgi:hypothetical protein